MIGHLFLEWLACNLNRHPCRHLRIAKKPPQRASLQAQQPTRALAALAAWATPAASKGSSLCPTAAHFCALPSVGAALCLASARLAAVLLPAALSLSARCDAMRTMLLPRSLQTQVRGCPVWRRRTLRERSNGRPSIPGVRCEWILSDAVPEGFAANSLLLCALPKPAIPSHCPQVQRAADGPAPRTSRTSRRADALQRRPLFRMRSSSSSSRRRGPERSSLSRTAPLRACAMLSA